MKPFVVAGLVFLAATWLAGAPAFAQCAGSCTVTFANNGGDKLLGDADGPYQSCDGCVLVRISSGGQLWMRTVCGSACSECNYTAGTCPASFPARSLVVDFSNPVTTISNCDVDDDFGQAGTLNICGSNSVRDVRFVAPTMFSSGALKKGSGVTLYMNLSPDFSNTAFILDFEANAGVTGDDMSRTLTAGPTAIAELYKVVKGKGGSRTNVSLGRFHMPFRQTTTR